MNAQQKNKEFEKLRLDGWYPRNLYKQVSDKPVEALATAALKHFKDFKKQVDDSTENNYAKIISLRENLAKAASLYYTENMCIDISVLKL